MSLSFGSPPFLECSSKGDKRFSAFYAKFIPNSILSPTIEEVFQKAKVFEDGSTGLSIAMAKGRKPVSFRVIGKRYPVSLLKEFYYLLWYYYLEASPHLIPTLYEYEGFSDIFGQEGHCCQAEAIYWYKQGKQPYKFD